MSLPTELDERKREREGGGSQNTDQINNVHRDPFSSAVVQCYSMVTYQVHT